MDDIKRQFGRQIRQLREEHDMTQQSLSDRMDVDRTYISKIENGRKNPTLETMYALSLQLETSLDTIFRRMQAMEV